MPDGDIQTYEVLMEANVRKQVRIEGRSPEHAAQIALDLCAQPQEMKVTLAPTWIEAVERCAATGELSMKIVGRCCRCNTVIVESPGREVTWTHPDLYSDRLLCSQNCGKDADG